jgi:subfamily B ATP-binding cassette protein MsbA
VRPYRGRLFVAIAAMALLAATTGLYPVLLDMLTTYLIEGTGGPGRVLEGPVTKLATFATKLGINFDPSSAAVFLQKNLILIFGSVVAIKAISQAVRFYQMGMIAQWVVRDLRRDLFAAIARQNTAFFGDQATGFLVSRVVNDVAQVERAATYAIPVLVGDVLKVLVLGAVSLSTYPELSLVAALVTPLAVVPIVRFGKLLKRYSKANQEELGGIAHRVTETVGGIRVVHAYGGEERELEKFDQTTEQYLKTMKKSVLVRAVQTPAMELIGVLALLLTIFYAVSKLESGAIRPGEVVGFLLALVLLYEPLKAIGRLNAFVVPGVASAERVFELVDRQSEVREKENAQTLVSPRSIHFEHVCFRYRESGPLVLDDVDLQLERGKIVALVGSSGSGKSTVAALLPRFFDVTSGKITADGVDLRDFSLSSLRGNIALVAQDNFLFDDTIRANILYGRPGATDAEVEAAAKRAYADEFIRALPNGYYSRTGERGVQLSGGQRQRIAIARAFLRDAPILILDEATSALDAESEREVQAALDALLVDRAALVIAHRLSTVRRADQILVLERGKVVERGSHLELLSKNAVYARLVNISEGAPCT